jgi:hypothetical protein
MTNYLLQIIDLKRIKGKEIWKNNMIHNGAEYTKMYQQDRGHKEAVGEA